MRPALLALLALACNDAGSGDEPLGDGWAGNVRVALDPLAHETSRLVVFDRDGAVVEERMIDGRHVDLHVDLPDGGAVAFVATAGDEDGWSPFVSLLYLGALTPDDRLLLTRGARDQTSTALVDEIRLPAILADQVRIDVGCGGGDGGEIQVIATCPDGGRRYHALATAYLADGDEPSVLRPLAFTLVEDVRAGAPLLFGPWRSDYVTFRVTGADELSATATGSRDGLEYRVLGRRDGRTLLMPAGFFDAVHIHVHGGDDTGLVRTVDPADRTADIGDADVPPPLGWALLDDRDADGRIYTWAPIPAGAGFDYLHVRGGEGRTTIDAYLPPDATRFALPDVGVTASGEGWQEHVTAVDDWRAGGFRALKGGGPARWEAQPPGAISRESRRRVMRPGWLAPPFVAGDAP